MSNKFLKSHISKHNTYKSCLLAGFTLLTISLGASLNGHADVNGNSNSNSEDVINTG